MTIQTREDKKGEIVVIDAPERVAGELADELRNLIGSLVKNKVYKIIIDFSHTIYIDSSGLGALVSRIAVTRSNHGDIRLANVGVKISNLLELTHLDKILIQYSSLQEALEGFKNDAITT
jgi:anti-sigma B factor antagonist